jgi:cell division protein FtsX
MGDFLRVELDLPLADTGPGRLLGWIAAALVLVAVLAFAVAATASASARRAALEPRLLTVLLPVADGAAPTDAEVDRVVAALNAEPGVAFARPVSPVELGLAPQRPTAVEPSAGPASPMPRFIDLAMNPGGPLDLEALNGRLATLAPGARAVASEGAESITPFAPAVLRALAGGAGVAALVALALVVAAITRVSLALHHDAVDLLRQLGASDAYLARQLEHHALVSSLRGGLLGFLAAVLTVLLGGGATHDAALAIALTPLDWLLLGIVPVAAALLGACAAGLAARTRLWRLP